ncbi:MAG: serine hydrolase domain-containing protein [Candidatus Thorarchaeota archaeon]
MEDKLDTKKLHEFLLEETKNDRYSGAVLIAKDGQPIFKEAYGLASKRYNVPNKVDTKFNIGSINKIFTKIALTKLVEQGKLDFDDLVGKYLPEFPEDIANKVTVRHLLSFTSGLGDYFGEKFHASIGNLRTLDDFVRLFIDNPLLFEPGEGNQYSNAGYVVLGKIIEAISGMGYYDFVKENIYKPAGMDNSDHYEMDSSELNMATGYTTYQQCCDERLDGPRRSNVYLIGTKGSSAGGGYSTLDDMLKFDLALHDNKILSPEYTGMIFRPINDTERKEIPGWVIAGGAPGLSAFMDKSYGTGYTIIVLGNYDPDDTEAVYSRVREFIHGKRS